MEILLEPTSNKLLVGTLSVLQPRSSEVEFINYMLILKLSKSNKELFIGEIHSRTKHIDVRYQFIKEKVEKGIVELFFIGTEYQLADLFTKALSVERFQYLVRQLGMRCLTPAELEALANEPA
nr:retrovirus-related Pol polyprotein from transposon TNT 1-94 [Tanacetum cinerariifolium]